MSPPPPPLYRHDLANWIGTAHAVYNSSNFHPNCCPGTSGNNIYLHPLVHKVAQIDFMLDGVRPCRQFVGWGEFKGPDATASESKGDGCDYTMVLLTPGGEVSRPPQTLSQQSRTFVFDTELDDETIGIRFRIDARENESYDWCWLNAASVLCDMRPPALPPSPPALPPSPSPPLPPTSPCWGGTSGELNILVCVDGHRCHGPTDGSQPNIWDCCEGIHGGRLKCPPDIPFMCAGPPMCGTGVSHCCEASCDAFNGPRPCAPPPSPPSLPPPMATPPSPSPSLPPPRVPPACDARLSCREIYEDSACESSSNGVYVILSGRDPGAQPIEVICDMRYGGWTQIFRRNNYAFDVRRAGSEPSLPVAICKLCARYRLCFQLCFSSRGVA